MKEQILEMLRERDGFVSGQEIGERVGTTRAAVWKQIARLREEGYRIESVPKNGYRLLNSPDLLTPEEIVPALKTALIGRTLIHYRSVGSTNAAARQLADRSAEEGTAVVAETQTGGKGRAGRSWESREGKGLWVSVLLRPETALNTVPLFTLMACAAVGKALETVAGGIGYKWPNDLTLGGKKLCGVLTEVSGEVDRIESLILGIGINVNQDEEDFPEPLRRNATSLRLALGRQTERKELLCRLFASLEELYLDYRRTGSMKPTLDYCREHLCCTGRRIRRQGGAASAEVFGLTDRGELLVKYAGGRTEALTPEGTFEWDP